MFIGKSMRNPWNLGHPWISPPPIPETPEIAKGDGQKLPKFGNPVGFCAKNLPLFTESKSLCFFR
jgi:hypothetical protein